MPAPTVVPEGISVALTSVGVGGPVGSQEGPGSPGLTRPPKVGPHRARPSEPAPACRVLHAPLAHWSSSRLACRPGALSPPGVGPSVVTASLRASGMAHVKCNHRPGGCRHIHASTLDTSPAPPGTLLGTHISSTSALR